jgi:NitT/TauT family transport system ATP-binding protein
MRAAPPVLTIEGLGMEFPARGRAAPTLALDDVGLSIAAGEFVALLGPSGCGKSTLLNLVAGFLRPTRGVIRHEGRVVTRPDATRTVVFQDYALFPWMNLRRNVEFGLKAQGVAAAERAARATEWLARVQLQGFEERYPHEVSGGMKQRAAIARSLAPEPSIVLMDEPFGALDAQTRVLLQEEVARITATAGRTVLFVTHGIEEAVFLADRIIVMSARPGRIRAEYAVPLPHPRTPDIRRDPRFVALVQDLWDALKPEWQDGEQHV